MSTPAQRRLLREFRRFQDDPPLGVTGAPTKDNILKWNAIIFGPEGTPFEGGTFKLTIDFTENYPYDPPIVRFVTQMFHPNISQDEAFSWIFCPKSGHHRLISQLLYIRSRVS